MHSSVVFEQLVLDSAVVVLVVVQLAFFADSALGLADFEMHVAVVVAAAEKNK